MIDFLVDLLIDFFLTQRSRESLKINFAIIVLLLQKKGDNHELNLYVQNSYTYFYYIDFQTFDVNFYIHYNLNYFSICKAYM